MKNKFIFSLSCLIKSMSCLVFISLMTFKGQAQLGGPPTIIVQPVGLSVTNGDTTIITATITSLTTMKLYWFYNGQPITLSNSSVLNANVPAVGTVSTLTINNTDFTNAGVYSLRVTNAVGSAMSSGATLIVLTPAYSNGSSNSVSFDSTQTQMVPGGFKFKLSGPIGSNLVIQASSDLKNWDSICTNLSTTGSITYTDTMALSLPLRYYRAKTQ